MRGEHPARHQERPTSTGSSPHARGTPACLRKRPHTRRIIPACAGNTGVGVGVWLLCGDHPRMRGEHTAVTWLLSGTVGSSPHARGTLPHPGGWTQHHGIIPACAGNTGADHSNHQRQRDHPRMRGEHSHLARKRVHDQGSSPHARGTRPAHAELPRDLGIIPACAGNTFVLSPVRVKNRDHPRMRGEHMTRYRPPVTRAGSSPHARGTHVSLCKLDYPTGIIPACAGNTPILPVSAFITRDHPRMRGEHGRTVP